MSCPARCHALSRSDCRTDARRAADLEKVIDEAQPSTFLVEGSDCIAHSVVQVGQQILSHGASAGRNVRVFAREVHCDDEVQVRESTDARGRGVGDSSAQTRQVPRGDLALKGFSGLGVGGLTFEQLGACVSGMEDGTRKKCKAVRGRQRYQRSLTHDGP